MLKFIAFGIVSTLLLTFMKSQKMELEWILRFLVCVLLLLYLVPYFEPIITIVRQLAEKAHIPTEMLSIILKIVGIAYLGQFGATLCIDAGEGVIAKYVDYTTKIAIFLTASPVVFGLFELLLDLTNLVI